MGARVRVRVRVRVRARLGFGLRSGFGLERGLESGFLPLPSISLRPGEGEG